MTVKIFNLEAIRNLMISEVGILFISFFMFLNIAIAPPGFEPGSQAFFIKAKGPNT